MKNVLKPGIGRRIGENNMMPHLLGGGPCLDTVFFPDNLIFRVSYLTDERALMRMLPPGIKPAGEPIVTFMFRDARQLDWVAGGVAKLFGIYVPARFKGKRDDVRGAYWPVLWENDTMATVFGREVLGVAKMHAEISSAVCHDGIWRVQVSDAGGMLFSLRLGNFVTMAAEKFKSLRQEALSAGVIGWKHIPSPDFSGTDLSYGIHMPSPSKIEEAWTGDADLTFHDTDPQVQIWSHQIMQTLRRLPLKKNLGAVMLKGTGEHRVSKARVVQ